MRAGDPCVPCGCRVTLRRDSRREPLGPRLAKSFPWGAAGCPRTDEHICFPRCAALQMCGAPARAWGGPGSRAGGHGGSGRTGSNRPPKPCQAMALLSPALLPSSSFSSVPCLNSIKCWLHIHRILITVISGDNVIVRSFN